MFSIIIIYLFFLVPGIIQTPAHYFLLRADAKTLLIFLGDSLVLSLAGSQVSQGQEVLIYGINNEHKQLQQISEAVYHDHRTIEKKNL